MKRKRAQQLKAEAGISIIEYALVVGTLLLTLATALPSFEDALRYRIQIAHETGETTLPCKVGLSADKCL